MARKAIFEADIVRELVLGQSNCRGQLCKKLDLSKASVTRLINDLIQKGIVEEGLRVSKSSRGRKTTTLKVREDFCYFMGTEIEGMATRACLLNCDKKVIASGKRSIGPGWSKSQIKKQWVSLLQKVLEDAGINKSCIVGLGVGLPGIVSRQNLTTRACLPPGEWVDFDIKKDFEKFKLKLNAANNVACVSEYEKRFGVAQGVDSFISLLVRYGIGASVYVGGKLMAGDEMSTGELGHMRIDVKGPVCICGQQGCLDVYASERTWNPRQFTTVNALEKELKKRAGFIAIGLANLIKLLHLPTIIMNGLYNEYEEIVRPVISETLAVELARLNLPSPQIVFGGVDELKVSIGSAMRAGEQFFKKYTERMLIKS